MFGIPDERSGEAVHAVVQVRSSVGADDLERELRDTNGHGRETQM
ncbi:hypothetical protein [Actinomycetospora atypica]|uniref:Uncharacterized protein n=1 Tax=Actinomycetospora atypica TaxID=1290095 RepID=A0ABV9YSI9_9PSEU